MVKKAVGVILWLLIITMEMLPQGAILNFNNPQNQVPIRLKFSHFDIRLLTHGNIGPFITAMLSVLAIIFLIIYFRKEDQKFLRGLKNICCIALIMSCTPIILGLHYLTKIGLLVSFLLILSLCWCNYMIDWT